MRVFRGLGMVAVCGWLVGCSSGEELTETGFTSVQPTVPQTTMTAPLTSSDPSGTTTEPTGGGMDGTLGMSASEGTGGSEDSGTGAPTSSDPTAASGDTDKPVFCGDGVTDVGEECDDGNQIDTDGCLKICVLAACGDLIIYTGIEDCDDGNMVETDNCLASCKAAVCGDGFVQAGVEGCDDGNAVDNDGCSNACKAGACGDGVVQAPEECDDMNPVNEDSCLSTCLTAKCGDGAVYAGVEACDGGGETPQCNSDCTGAACGDGKTNASAGEQCDTGGQSAQCDGNCTAVQCGDGTVNAQAGEACDDGNANNGDGCSAACQVEIVQACTGGNDPKSGSPWVVCAADVSTIWLSHNVPGSGGIYHPQKICADLGYPTLLQYGGTCGNTCGYCNANASCGAPGPLNFDSGGYGGCGADEFGTTLCQTVMWRCSK